MKAVFEIATLLIGVAVLALLINKADETVKVISTTGGAFNELLRTVSLQQK